MKRLPWTSIISGMFLAFCFAFPVNAFEIGARASYWFPSFKTDMKADSAGLTGDVIDVKDELDVGNESFPVFEAFGGVGPHRLSLSYTPVKYSGTTTLTTPITFNGETFAAGSTVDTDLKFRMLDLEYQYIFLDLENLLAGFSLSAIGQVKFLDGESKMVAPADHTSAEHKVRAPIPMVGIGAHVGLLTDILEARAKVTGIGYSDNYLYEASADLSLTPVPFLDLSAGYRIIRFKLDRDDFYLDSQFDGPYVGVTVSF